MLMRIITKPNLIALLIGLPFGPFVLDTANAAVPPIDEAALGMIFVFGVIGIILVIGIQTLFNPAGARAAIYVFGFIAFLTLSAGVSAAVFSIAAGVNQPPAYMFLLLGAGLAIGVWASALLYNKSRRGLTIGFGRRAEHYKDERDIEEQAGFVRSLTRSFSKFSPKHFAVFAVLFVAVMGGVHYSIRSSDAFKVASTYVRANTDVVSLVGIEPEVSLAWFSKQSVRESGGGGSALLSLRVDGYVGSVDARVELAKRGNWTVTAAEITSQNDETIRIEIQ